MDRACSRNSGSIGDRRADGQTGMPAIGPKTLWSVPSIWRPARCCASIPDWPTAHPGVGRRIQGHAGHDRPDALYDPASEHDREASM